MIFNDRKLSTHLVDYLLIVLAIFVPYHQVAGHRFIEFDDGMYTFYNTYMMKGLNWDSIVWAFTNYDVANWHPLTWISHLIDRELFGPFPGGYLLENVGLHAVAACLLYKAFRDCTNSRFFGFVVALIFAIHPANVENVAWTSERKSILNAIFWFAAICSYSRFLKTRAFAPYGLTIIFHLLGLMCKAMSVTLPCTLALVYLLNRYYAGENLGEIVFKREGLKKLILPLLPLLFISIYFSALTASAQSMAMAGASYTLNHRLVNVTLSYGRYVDMFFHPNRMAIFYPLYDDELSWRNAIPYIALLFGISAACIYYARSKPQLIIGWLWYLGTMLPVIGLVQVGSQSHADRYLYIPMIGLSFLFPVLFEGLRSLKVNQQKILTALFLGGTSISLIAATNLQVSYWEDGVALFSHSISITGDCITSVVNLGAAYGRTGRNAEAIAFIDSKFALCKNDQHKASLDVMKASAFFNEGKYKEAVTFANKAVELGSSDSNTYWILAVAHYQLKEKELAAQYLAKARAGQKIIHPANYVEVNLNTQMDAMEKRLKEDQDNQSKDKTLTAAQGEAALKS